MRQHNDEIEFKDILNKLLEYKSFLIKNKSFIVKSSCLLLIVGIVWTTFILPVKYKAELTFVVDGDVSQSLSGMGSLAGKIGLDIGNLATQEGIFTQNNVIELLRTRGVIDKVLMQSAKIEDKNDLLINHYIEINDEDLLFSGNNYTKDSIRGILWYKIVESHLNIELQSEQANIITLSYTSLNEEFAKHFVDKLINQMSKRYVEHQTAQANNTLGFLQNRADSVFLELKIAEEEFAKIQDINQRIVKASGRLNELQLRRRVQVLNAMYIEIIKNLELSKLTLLNKTPIINIIDMPILPLENNKVSMIFGALVGSLLGFLLSVCYLIFKKIFTDALR